MKEASGELNLTVITIIAISVVINSYFYTSNVWLHLFGHNSKHYLYIVYIASIFSANFVNFEELIMIADNFFLMVAIPNIIGLFILRNVIVNEIKEYYNIKNSQNII